VQTLVNEIRKREARKAENDRVLNRPMIDHVDAIGRSKRSWMKGSGCYDRARLTDRRCSSRCSTVDHDRRAEGWLGAPVGAEPDPWGVLAKSCSQALASLMPASWNQIVPWLCQIDGLRRAP
jgi:hypothetical protein